MQNLFVRLSISFALLFIVAASNLAAEVCINADLKTSKLRGIVQGYHKGEEKTLAGATVKVRQFSNSIWNSIAEVKTNELGEFNVSQIKPGKYEVIVQSEGFMPTSAYVSLSNRHATKKRIVFTLRMALEGCGEATMRSDRD